MTKSWTNGASGSIPSRHSLLEGAPPKETLIEMIDNQVDDAAKRFLADDYGAASFAEWVGQRLGVELTAREIKGA